MDGYDRLRGEFLENRWSRRQFVKLALALGVSGGAISSFLAGCAPVPVPAPKAPSGETPAAKAPETTSGQNVKLTYWTVLGNVDGIIMDALVKQYTTQNPNIQIESLQGVEDYEAKLQSAVLTGTGPDITLFRLHYVGPYAARTVVVPIESGEAAQIGIKKDDFDPRVWDATSYEGKQYALPFDIHLFSLFYNKKLFKDGGLDPEQPPKTLEEWHTMAKTLNKGDVIGTSIYTWPPGMFWIYYGLMKQFGAELFLDNGSKVDLTTPGHIDPLKWWHSLRWDINPKAQDGDLIRTGKVGLWLDGPWTLSLWSDPEKSKVVDDYAVTLMPQNDPKNPAVWANSHCLALPKPAKQDDVKRQEALKFMKWLTEHSFDWSDKAGQIPASSIVRNSDAWQEGAGKILQGSREFAQALPYANYFPQHKMMFEVADRIAAAIDGSVNIEKSNIEDEMAKATQEVNKILAQK